MYYFPNVKGPRLEKLMSTYDGKADFAKVDIDQLTDLAFEYKVNVFKLNLVLFRVYFIKYF